MSDLRPIGTEFWHEFPLSKISTLNVQSRFLYRIESHKLCARFDGDEVGELKEILQPLKHETRNVTSMTQVQCSECGNIYWKYEFDEWQEGGEG
jgi:hypothetical protein